MTEWDRAKKLAAIHAARELRCIAPLHPRMSELLALCDAVDPLHNGWAKRCGSCQHCQVFDKLCSETGAPLPDDDGVFCQKYEADP